MDEKKIDHPATMGDSSLSKKRSSDKPGLIYLSTVPDFMSVQKLRNVFSEYGEINRTFFQPVEKSYNYKKGLLFSEGWVEFKQRSVAKYVARVLNNTSVGGKKKQPWYSCIWNIKYLPKFTWTDVNADRELKSATHASRIRTEISQAKKQANYYINSIDRSEELKKIKKRKEKRGEVFDDYFEAKVRQRKTDQEIVVEKRQKRSSEEQSGSKAKKPKSTFGSDNFEASRTFVMKNIFGSG